MFVESYFIDGTSNVNALSRNRSLMMAGSDISVKLFAMELSVGYLSEHEAALRIEQPISHKVIENDDLNIAGTYYTLADDRIIRAFIGPSGKEMYSFVKEIPKPQKVEEIPEVPKKWGLIDSIQLGLDGVGLFPVFGEAADLLNLSLIHI